MQKMDEYNNPALSLGMPCYTSAQPYGVPAGYTLPPPPPGPPPMRWANLQQEALSQIQDPRFQQASMQPSYQIDTPYTPYAWAPPPQQHQDAVAVNAFAFAPPPTHAMPAQPRRPSALGGLVKDVMSAGRNAIDSVKQDSGAQGWKNAAHAFQGVTINRPPPLPTRPSTLQTGSSVQNFQYNAPGFQEQVAVSPVFQGQVAVSPVFQEQVAVSPVFPKQVAVSPVFPKQVAMSPVEQVAPKPEIKRKPVRPLGDQVKSMGTSAVNFVKSEKGASLLSGAATALNFIASAADPDDPDMAGLTFFNTVVQSQVQKSKAKQAAEAEAQAAVPTTSETTQDSRERDNTPQNMNPLAGLPPEQLMLIIVMAARLQQEAAIEQAQVADPGDPEVPDLSTLNVDDPPEASVDEVQATARDAKVLSVAPASAPMMAPPQAPAPAVEEEAVAATGPSNLQKAGNVGKAYMNIAIKANSNPLGTSMNMWSEIGRQVNKYRAKQATGTAEPRTMGDMASAFGTALMKSIERVGAPSEGQDNSVASLMQRYQESEVVAQQRLQEIEATEAAFNNLFPSQVSSNTESNDGPVSPSAAVAAAPVGSATTGSLERALAGNYRYLRTGNGWNENNSYALGTNGRFSFSIGSSVIAVSLDERVSAYAYDVTNPTGTWRAQGDVNNGTLILNHDDGSVEHRSYQRASDGKFYVGGMRWFSV
ncbi:hypothetical protein F5X68DRAFT_259432 [Plectosphaerella plurivora]|uniref:Uncharacterized protein n=1 Tax=Plectosphaerella plurivora TaxID=936078 RepID=A0A9P9ACR1_9PEZI|nr:hypothetical protein F5X68DRAFT_259432 [Plectosphaerella plurivora]